MHNEAVPVTLDGIGGHIVRIRRIVERLTITRERWEMERIGNGVQNQLERAVARKETA